MYRKSLSKSDRAFDLRASKRKSGILPLQHIPSKLKRIQDMKIIMKKRANYSPVPQEIREPERRFPSASATI
jgi:hypothetical protein